MVVCISGCVQVIKKGKSLKYQTLKSFSQVFYILLLWKKGKGLGIDLDLSVQRVLF